MSELFSRFKAKLKEIFYETPLPNLLKKLEPKHEPPYDIKPDGLDDLPDNFADIKLDKTDRVYHVKLKDIGPTQWMQVGSSLRNLAYEDPEYGHEVTDSDDPEDPLPPPPEPTEYQKNMKEPLISVNLKNLTWVELEELGELFYDLGWNHRKEYDMDNYDGLPDEWNDCDEFPTTEESEFEEALFDPIKKVEEEITEVKRITNSDVIPGIEKVPWKDDAEVWLENPHPDTPPWEDTPQPDFPPQGKVYPLQSNLD